MTVGLNREVFIGDLHSISIINLPQAYTGTAGDSYSIVI